MENRNGRDMDTARTPSSNESVRREEDVITKREEDTATTREDEMNRDRKKNEEHAE